MTKGLGDSPVWIGGFRLTARIGGGAVGDVYEAVREGDDLVVALKLLHPGIDNRPMARAVFYDEVRAVAALDHPGVVRILDVGQLKSDEADALGRVAGAPWFAMERLTGPAPTLPAADAGVVAATIRELLDALAHVHARGVLHRDIKPTNLRLAWDDGPIRLIDFGLASLLASGPSRRAFTAVWAAPEQTADGAERDEGPWTDLFAVGALAYAMTTGAPPWPRARDALNAHRNAAQVPRPRFQFPLPARFGGWLDRMLALRPRERFQTAADARNAFEQIAAIALPAPRPLHQNAPRPRDAATIRAARRTRLVGRDAELRSMALMLQAVVSDQTSHTVVMTAPDGAGVTRTVTAFCEHAGASGAAISFEIAHDPGARADEAMQSALARHLGVTGDAPDAVEQRLYVRYGDELDHTTRSSLAALITGTANSGSYGADERIKRYDTLAALIGLEARSRPVVLAFHDTHWGAGSLDFVRWWQTSGPDLPVLLVLTATTEELARRPSIPDQLDRIAASQGSRRIELHPLPPGAIRDLLATWVNLPESVVHTIVQRARGRPRLAIDLVRAWLLDGETDVETDMDIAELWLVRMTSLVGDDPAGLDALAMAAMMGRIVPIPLWRAACSHRGLQFEPDWLAELVRADAIHMRAPNIHFRHDLLRQTLLRDAQQRGSLRSLHASCAEAMTTLQPRAVRYARRAHHLIRAGRIGEGLALTFESAEAAWRRGDRATALEQLNAFAVADDGAPEHALLRTHADSLRAMLYRTDARHEDAWHAARRAFETASQLGDPYAQTRALRAIASVSSATGAYADAEIRLREAAALLDKIDAPQERARIRAELGHMARQRGDLDLAEAEMRTALADFAAVDDSLGVGDANRGLADIAWDRGAIEEARTFLVEARRSFEIADNPLRLAECDNSFAENLRARGRYAEAEDFYRRALDVIARLARTHEPFVRLNLSLCLLESGRCLEAYEEVGRAIAHRHVRANHAVQAIAASVRSVTLVSLERFDEACDEIRRADDAFGASGIVERDSARCLRRAADGLDAAGYAAEAAIARARASCMAERLGLS